MNNNIFEELKNTLKYTLNNIDENKGPLENKKILDNLKKQMAKYNKENYNYIYNNKELKKEYNKRYLQKNKLKKKNKLKEKKNNNDNNILDALYTEKAP